MVKSLGFLVLKRKMLRKKKPVFMVKSMKSQCFHHGNRCNSSRITPHLGHHGQIVPWM
jgi:hypothetical protein